MKDNFSRCLTYVLNSEGGYVNNPADRGGPTNYGITQAVYDEYRQSHGLPQQSVKMIAGVEVEAIYNAKYWMVCRCDDLPVGVDYATFDYAVNSGDKTAELEVEHAVIALQQGVGVVLDGVIGPVTLAAVSRCDPKALIDDICDDRLVMLKHCKNYSVFGKGWKARVDRVRAQAKEMLL